MPPHSEEAERGVLGCVLVSPESAAGVLGQCRRTIHDEGLHFYALSNRLIWQGLCGLANGERAIDVITLQQWLRDRGKLAEVGGVAYLAGLPDAVPSAANVAYYLDILREQFVLRRMVGACSEVIADIYEAKAPPERLLETLEGDVEALKRDAQDPATRGRRLKKPMDD